MNEQKRDLNVGLLAQAGASPLLAAYLEWNHLKSVYRRGWLRRGLSRVDCETVAEHILGVAMLAWWACDQVYPELDSAKALRLALVHDLGEIYAGDLIPADGVDREEKLRRERAAARRLLAKLTQGQAYLALWEEYEAGQSGEARLVRQLDRLEMALQALIYEQDGMGRLDEFFQSAGEGIQAEPIRALYELALQLRQVVI